MENKRAQCIATIIFFSLPLNSLEKNNLWWTQQLMSALTQNKIESAQKAIQNGAKTKKAWENLMWQAAFALILRDTKPVVYHEQHALFCTTIKTALGCGMIPRDKFLILPLLTFDQTIIQPYLKTISVNIDCGNRWSLLHHAVSSRALETVTLLVERGASIYAKNRSGLRPIDLDTTQEIKTYLTLVADFYTANGTNKQTGFKFFAKKYLSNEKHRIETYRLVHLGEKKFALELYRWLKKHNHLDSNMPISRGISWFYLELARRETDNLFRQYCWFKECFTYYAGNNQKYIFEQTVEKQIRERFMGKTRDLLTTEKNRWVQKKKMYNLTTTMTGNQKRSNLVDIKIFCAKKILP